MFSFIKNNYCYLGSISFRIDPTAYIREPDHYNDLMTLCPNAEPLNTPGNWYVEWGIEPLQEGKDLRQSALAYVFCEEGVTIPFGPSVYDYRCQNLDGFQIIWGNEFQQDMRFAFPHEEGLYFIHVVLQVPGTPGLADVQNLRNHRILQTLLQSLHRDDSLFDYAKRSISALNLSLRVFNAVRRSGRVTIEDVLVMTYEEMYRIQGLGEKGRAELVSQLEKSGYDASHLYDPDIPQ